MEPHYCAQGDLAHCSDSDLRVLGASYKEIAGGDFTDTNCKLCGATATKRKSRIIHLGVKHELVLPFINEEPRSDDNQNKFVIAESEVKSENEEHYEDFNGVQKVKMDFDEPEPKVVTLLSFQTPSHKISAFEDADSGNDVSED